jgi:hypothetical protein
VKIYALIHDENIDRHVLTFELDMGRYNGLVDLCKANNISEAVVPFREWTCEPLCNWPALPTDGFISEVLKDAFSPDDWDPDDTSEIDKDMITLECMHIGTDGQVHIELVDGHGDTYWSEGLEIHG